MLVGIECKTRLWKLLISFCQDRLNRDPNYNNKIREDLLKGSMILFFRIKTFIEMFWQKHYCRTLASMCRIICSNVQQLCGVIFLDVLLFFHSRRYN